MVTGTGVGKSKPLTEKQRENARQDASARRIANGEKRVVLREEPDEVMGIASGEQGALLIAVREMRRANSAVGGSLPLDKLRVQLDGERYVVFFAE